MRRNRVRLGQVQLLVVIALTLFPGCLATMRCGGRELCMTEQTADMVFIPSGEFEMGLSLEDVLRACDILAEFGEECKGEFIMGVYEMLGTARVTAWS
jgi:hypothetical protein